MPFCPECGKPVAEKAKFCRNCGASQTEDIAPAPAAAPVSFPAAPPAPGPEPVPAQPAAPAPETVRVPPVPVPAEPAGLRCTSCNNPLAPGEKFCGACGAKAGGASGASAVPNPAQPVCPGCGTPALPGTKFCGGCGMAVGGTAPVAPPVPAPVASPAPASNGIRLCTACGNPIKPSDKYCSKCLVMVKDAPAAPPLPVNSPPPAAAPAPVVAAASPAPSPAGGMRLCTACGNPIKPGDKYCSKCLVMVKDAPAAPAPAPAAYIPPAAAPAAASPDDGYVCASCSSPLAGAEKFCGVCGAPAVAAGRAAVPAQKTCSKCGAPVSDTTKFCGGCGAPVGASFPQGTVSPAAGGEEVLGVIPNVKKMKMFGASWDTYTIVITPRRMIFAQLTQAMMNTAIAEAQAKAKAEGKGFFGIVKDQMAASFGFGRRYETMSPESALTETTGNFALENQNIRTISLKLIESGSEGMEWQEFKMILDSAQGRMEYVIAEDDRFTSLLQNVYGDRVNLPFGLFKAGPVRVKFF